MYDVIIIGAGCAGMTAAVYCRRAGKNVLVLEALGIGGQIAVSPKVENFPSIKQISGMDFSNNLYEQASELGAEFDFDTVTGISDNGDTKTVHTENGDKECKAVIIATGMKHRTLGIEREEELTGSGVSYCAVCDGSFFRGQSVAVCGGGNTALQDALYLANYCPKVYLIHRRDAFRAEPYLVNQLEGIPQVEPVMDSVIEKLNGEKALGGLTVKNVKTGQTSELKVTGLFVAVGQTAQNEPFRALIELDEYGFIKAGEDCKTNVPGIFAAGDCRTKEIRQLATAASDGAVAALAASRL